MSNALVNMGVWIIFQHRDLILMKWFQDHVWLIYVVESPYSDFYIATNNLQALNFLYFIYEESNQNIFMEHVMQRKSPTIALFLRILRGMPLKSCLSMVTVFGSLATPVLISSIVVLPSKVCMMGYFYTRLWVPGEQAPPSYFVAGIAILKLISPTANVQWILEG